MLPSKSVSLRRRADAISLNALQKASSRLMLVLRPARTTERLMTGASIKVELQGMFVARLHRWVTRSGDSGPYAHACRSPEATDSTRRDDITGWERPPLSPRAPLMPSLRASA